MSTPPTTNQPGIERLGGDYFRIRLAPGSGEVDDSIIVHREQVRFFFQYDRTLRRKDDQIPGVPAGYHQFVETYHQGAKTKARFAYQEVDESGETYTIFSGPPPTKEEVLGREADLRSQEEIEGGKVLNGAEAETNEGTCSVVTAVRTIVTNGDRSPNDPPTPHSIALTAARDPLSDAKSKLRNVPLPRTPHLNTQLVSPLVTWTASSAT